MTDKGRSEEEDSEAITDLSHQRLEGNELEVDGDEICSYGVSISVVQDAFKPSMTRGETNDSVVVVAAAVVMFVYTENTR